MVGHVAKAHGVRGEVAVEVRTDFPERRFAVGNVLHTDRPGIPQLAIKSVRPHSGRLLVLCDEVLLRDTAEALKGTLLTIDVDDAGSPVQEPTEEAWWDTALLGLAARTVDGQELGSVADVLHGPGGDLLSSKRKGQRELLVPFVHDIVPTVDPDAGVVVIDPPPGLLEL